MERGERKRKPKATVQSEWDMLTEMGRTREGVRNRMEEIIITRIARPSSRRYVNRFQVEQQESFFAQLQEYGMSKNMDLMEDTIEKAIAVELLMFPPSKKQVDIWLSDRRVFQGWVEHVAMKWATASHLTDYDREIWNIDWVRTLESKLIGGI
eukprot:CAMPEP_0197527176 /NCGR_PEP_ID=MMETSP1318-20131121/20589_1 /TAXON_ID=552666 /ORGANISM="Partenskyella glossopodia, Strain RCC365" /LENGTH=152 /DNA_ID=CAMNT_0043081683 /DNA_START=270 /DNA_END=728 /DNA_ORIENTATION=-